MSTDGPQPEPEELPVPVVLGPFDLMAQASTAAEIGQIQKQFPEEDCQAAWKQLDPVQRSALLLARYFDGSSIVYDPDNLIDP